jgi:hypothetical protein
MAWGSYQLTVYNVYYFLQSYEHPPDWYTLQKIPYFKKLLRQLMKSNLRQVLKRNNEEAADIVGDHFLADERPKKYNRARVLMGKRRTYYT